MNKEICKIIVEQKNDLVPYIFTKKQMSLLEKYIERKILTNTEKSYLYSTLKKKTDALATLRTEFSIRGNIPEKKINKAKEILLELNKDQAFISGSFLYKEDYSDIDIYIIGKKRKEQKEGNRHFIYITEKDLKKPIFYSAWKYSVSNFNAGDIIPMIKRPESDDVIFDYELAIGEILENDDQKMLRSIVFEYHMNIKKTILDSYSLYKQFEELKKRQKKEKIDLINNMTKQLLLNLYSKKYIYNELLPFLKQLKKIVQEHKKHDNVLIYIDLFTEVKNECRRAET